MSSKTVNNHAKQTQYCSRRLCNASVCSYVPSLFAKTVFVFELMVLMWQQLSSLHLSSSEKKPFHLNALLKESLFSS